MTDAYVPRENLQLWLKADSLTLNNGTAVATWPDASGNANHATQAVAANQPVYIAGALNAKPAVRFDAAAKKYLTVADVPGLMPSQQVTMVAVARRTTSASTAAMMIMEKGITTTDADNGYSLRFQTTTSAGSYVNGNGSTAATALDPYYVLMGIYDREKNKLFVNGGATSASYTENPYAAAIAPRATPLSIGGRLAASTLLPQYNLQGDIAEILVYGRAISRAERRDLEAYLRSKYLVGVAPSADVPVFSVNTGTYGTTQSVTLSCADFPGVIIYYTLDGSDPSDGGNPRATAIPYSSPRVIDSGKVTIKARAFKSGYVQPADPAISVITIDTTTKDLPRQGLQAWFRGDSFPSEMTDEAPVGTWTDQSGNLNNADAGTAAPTLEHSGPNSKRSVEFASGQWLSALHSASLQADQVSVFALVKRSSGATTAVIAEKFVSSTSYGYSLLMPNSTSVRLQVGSITATSSVVPSTYYVAEGVFDQSNVKTWINGDLVQSAVRTTAMPDSAAPLMIGGRAGTATFTGEIAEILIYGRGLTDWERADVQAYLNNKYTFGKKPKLAHPQFSLQGGIYAKAQELRLSAQAGATIWYQIGSATGAWTEYKGAIPLQESVTTDPAKTYVVYAKAEKDGYWPSDNGAGPASVTITIDKSTSTIPRDAMELWLKAGAAGVFTLDGSNLVSEWRDLSGKGNHATQSGALRPKFVANPTGLAAGNPAVEFTGASLTHLRVPDAPGLNPKAVSVFAIAKRNSKTAVRDTIIAKNSDASGYSLQYGDTSDMVVGSINANYLSFANVNAVYGSVCLVYDGTTQTFYPNATDVVTDAYAGPIAITSGDLTIGGVGATKNLDGGIVELLVYSRALSSDEVTALQAYAHKTYGIGAKPKAAKPSVNFADGKIISDADAKLVFSSESKVFYTTSPTALPAESADWTEYKSTPISFDGKVTYRYFARRDDHLDGDVGSITLIKDTTAMGVTEAKPKVWFRGDNVSLSETNPGSVALWKNSSVDGDVNVRQTTASSQPEYRAAAVNGKPALSFDGAADFMRTDAGGYLNYQTGTVIVVAKPSGGAYDRCIFRDVDEGRLYAYGERDNTGERWTGPQLYTSDGTVTMALTYPSGYSSIDTPRYLIARHSAGRANGSYAILGGEWRALNHTKAYTGYNEGQGALTQNNLSDIGSDQFVIGRATSNAGTAANSFGGEIAEFLIFDRIIEADERSKVNAYLNARYAIEDALPEVMKPRFSPATGTYVTKQDVTITSSLGAEIYCSDDDLDPFVGGDPFVGAPRPVLPPKYSPYNKQPIEVLTKRTLTARAAYLVGGSIPKGGWSDVSVANITIDESTASVSRKGLKLWLKADAIREEDRTSAGKVRRWEDQSGAENHLQQDDGDETTNADDLKRPMFISAAPEGLNSRPTVSFAGGLRNLILADQKTLDLKQISIVAVAKRIGGTESAFILRNGDGESGYSLIMDNMSTVRSRLDASSKLGTLSASEQGKYNVLVSTYDQKLHKVYINGVLAEPPGEREAEIGAFAGPLSVGASESTSAFNGEIAELLVYDHALGDDELRGLQDYFYGKYRVGAPAVAKPQFIKDDAERKTVFTDGVYASPQKIVISSPDGGSVYYTTNGEVPTLLSPLYPPPTDPAYPLSLNLAKTQTVKAVAIVGGISSPVAVLKFSYDTGDLPADEADDLPTDNGGGGYSADTDKDGVPDALEIALGSDPTVNASTPSGGVERSYLYDKLRQLKADGIKNYNYDAEGNASRN